MSTVGHLDEEAKKRKQRLLALRAKKEGKAVEEITQEHADQEEISLPKPIFRTYKPADEALKEGELGQPKLVEVADKISDVIKAASTVEPTIEEVDLAALAPRKPDWDLKRDVSKKLEKLERRTQRAIAELIRERLQTESSDGTALARAVESVGSREIEDDD